MEWILTVIVVPLLIGLYLGRLQQKRAKLRLSAEMKERKVDTRKSVHRGPGGVRRIVSIGIVNGTQRPLELPTAFVAVVQFWPRRLIRSIPDWWPLMHHYALDLVDHIPISVLPGTDVPNLETDGYHIATILEDRGISGVQLISVGVFDDSRNAYYSEIIRADLDEWKTGAGGWLISLSPFG